MFEFLQPRNGPVMDGLEKQEVIYAADQPQYIPLRTLQSRGPHGAVLSRWTLTDEQRKAVAEGADIILELSTFGNPLQPIRMIVTDGKVNMDWFIAVMLAQPVTAVEMHDESFTKSIGIKID